MTLPFDVVPAPSERSTRGMVRRSDPETSTLAAEAVEPRRSKLQQLVLMTFRARGPMTDAELEVLPEFMGLGPSTIRKRRSELYQRGDLVKVGRKCNARGRVMEIWDVTR